jgi:hypothetical protein
MRDGVRGLGWGLLLPTEAADPSFSGFLLAAGPLLLVCLYRQRRAMDYVDALAPSLLIGLSVVKIGCLAAGCCAGRMCDSAWGVCYPYGSRPYEAQWRGGHVHPPAELLRMGDNGEPRLLGHVQWLQAREQSLPRFFSDHAAAHRLSVNEVVRRAELQRSRPVWPVPVWYIAGAAALWLASELIFRKCPRPGVTTGSVLLAYAVLRLLCDIFPARSGAAWHGLTGAEWVAVASGAVGAAVLVWSARVRHSGPSDAEGGQ